MMSMERVDRCRPSSWCRRELTSRRCECELMSDGAFVWFGCSCLVGGLVVDVVVRLVVGVVRVAGLSMDVLRRGRSRPRLVDDTGVRRACSGFLTREGLHAVVRPGIVDGLLAMEEADNVGRGGRVSSVVVELSLGWSKMLESGADVAGSCSSATGARDSMRGVRPRIVDGPLPMEEADDVDGLGRGPSGISGVCNSQAGRGLARCFCGPVSARTRSVSRFRLELMMSGLCRGVSWCLEGVPIPIRNC